MNILTEKEVNRLRDSAISLEKIDIKLSYQMMKIAFEHRKHGQAICRKLKGYEYFINSGISNYSDDIAKKIAKCQVNSILKVFYIHIPKTGGTSIERSNIFTPFTMGHHDYSYFTSLLSRNIVDYKCFTTVRNPWDRLASAFFYLSIGGCGSPLDMERKKLYVEKYKGDFKEFLIDFYNCPEYFFNCLHFKKMTDFIKPSDVKIPVFIQKLEDINNRGGLENFLNIKIELGNERQSNIKLEYKIYDDVKCYNMVSELYKDDLDAFNYTDWPKERIKY